MHKFHIFNVFFYFDAYILKKKKRKKASFMSGVFLCASPFSQVTRLKVKKSDKFYVPSTFCDYLKGKKNMKFFSLNHKKSFLERTISVPC